MSNIITGERIQQLCDIYLGFNEDFAFNPFIFQQTNKHYNLNSICEPFNNPKKVFCYSHRIHLLSEKIHLFQNEFILVTHNSDGEIRNTNEVNKILNCDKLLKWYGQNICTEHHKLNFLPIGLANSQWQHGNLALFYNNEFIDWLKNSNNKLNNIYFNFNVNTNPNKRQICYDLLINKLEWLQPIHPVENQKRLATYKFCICPEGNGVDSHRLWECLYLRVVPIVIQSEFTSILVKQNIPLVVLDNWLDFDVNKLNYSDFDFNCEKLQKLLNLQNYLNI